MVSVPWIDPERDAQRNAEVETTLADVYRGSLDRNVRRVTAVVRAFLEAPAGPVVLTAQPARTAPGWRWRCCSRRRECRVSTSWPTTHSASKLSAFPSGHPGHPGPPAARAYAEEHWRTRPATMTAALAHLDATYGGVLGYLRGPCGLASEEIEAARGRLTRPA